MSRRRRKVLLSAACLVAVVVALMIATGNEVATESRPVFLGERAPSSSAVLLQESEGSDRVAALPAPQPALEVAASRAEVDLLVHGGMLRISAREATTGRAIESFSVRVVPDAVLSAEFPSIHESTQSGSIAVRAPAGVVEVFASARRAGQVAIGHVTALCEPNAEPVEVDVELQQGAVLRGIVLDEATKRPIVGARVVNSVVQSFAEREAKTDAAGGFRLEPWPTGIEAGITVTAEGYGQNAVRILVEPDGSWSAPERLSAPESSGLEAPFLTVYLPQQRQIRGRLVGPTGTALVGATASATGHLLIAERFGRMDEARTTTAHDGGFLLSGLRPDISHVVWVHAARLAPRAFLVPAGAAHEDLGLIELGVGGSVSGRVVDQDGRPIGGLIVEAICTAEGLEAPSSSSMHDGLGLSGAPKFEKAAETRPDGGFVLEGLPSGAVSIRTSFGPASRTVQLLVGQDLRLDVPLSIDGWRHLEGVVDGEGNLDDVEVVLLDTRGATLTRDDLDDHGAFHLWGVRPGRSYTVEVRRDGHSLWREVVDTGASEPVRLSIE